ncbi:hypothetical protein Tco_0943651 [Tanacetum coccineum]
MCFFQGLTTGMLTHRCYLYEQSSTYLVILSTLSRSSLASAFISVLSETDVVMKFLVTFYRGANHLVDEGACLSNLEEFDHANKVPTLWQKGWIQVVNKLVSIVSIITFSFSSFLDRALKTLSS